MDSDLSYQLAFGSYEDALAMVGTAGQPRTAATPVSGARIQLFASLVCDGNRSYWDAEFARQTWGGLLAPPALLMGWLIPPPWQPGGRPPAASMVLRVPLPGTTFINAANDLSLIHISASRARTSSSSPIRGWDCGRTSRGSRALDEGRLVPTGFSMCCLKRTGLAASKTGS